MSTPLINAGIFLAGVNLSAQSNQVALEYSAEALDSTTFGSASRTFKGGLKVARATGAGFWVAGVGELDAIVYDEVGLSDTVFTAFPDTIVEGSTSSGAGYAFQVTVGRYTIGGAVGDLMPFAFEAEGRGIQA